jgi:CheY-like chemotaxis protein
MERSTLQHLFEPFFTTKGVGRGTGLGLATVYGIVKQNQGYIEVASTPGQGTCFRIYLPRFSGEALEAEEAGELAAPRARGETILLVEDEPMILSMGQAMLERLGYRVLPASTPEQALRLAGDGAFQLLLTDVIMPRINGWDLARLLQERLPGLKCLFMSGYTADALAPSPAEGVRLLQKPFSIQDLAVRVREALEGREKAP